MAEMSRFQLCPSQLMTRNRMKGQTLALTRTSSDDELHFLACVWVLPGKAVSLPLLFAGRSSLRP